MNEFNFITKNVSDEDKELFFGNDEEFIEIESHWILAHVLARAGVFSSVSQARKQGANVPIPRGFTILQRGKNQRQKNIFILNLMPEKKS